MNDIKVGDYVIVSDSRNPKIPSGTICFVMTHVEENIFSIQYKNTRAMFKREKLRKVEVQEKVEPNIDDYMNPDEVREFICLKGLKVIHSHIYFSILVAYLHIHPIEYKTPTEWGLGDSIENYAWKPVGEEGRVYGEPRKFLKSDLEELKKQQLLCKGP